MGCAEERVIVFAERQSCHHVNNHSVVAVSAKL